MAQKHFTQRSLADAFIPLKKQKIGRLHLIDQHVDWRPISSLRNRKYLKGKDLRGRQAYQPLLLFKMMLLQTWYILISLQKHRPKTN